MDRAEARIMEELFKEHIFGWMCRDIEAAIRGGANFLAALGLSGYTEVMGGLKTGKLLTEGRSRCNYDAFLPYLGETYVALDKKLKGEQKDSEGNRIGLYRAVRCGLAHEYFIKGPSTVEMDSSVLDVFPGVENFNCGIKFDSGRLIFNVNIYYRDFKAGLKRYYDELLHGEGLDAFKNCLVELFKRQEVIGPTVQGSSGGVFVSAFRSRSPVRFLWLGNLSRS